MKKIISLGILILMAVLCSVPVSATCETTAANPNGLITPKLTYISLLTAELSINSSGKATCKGQASAYDSTHTTMLTVQLQKSNGSSWSTIKSWTASSTGTAVATVDQDYYVVHGTYRVCATARVYNYSGDLLESKSVYSNTVVY